MDVLAREIGTPPAQRRDPDEQGTRGQFKPGLIDEAHEISDETTRMFLYRWVEKLAHTHLRSTVAELADIGRC